MAPRLYEEKVLPALVDHAMRGEEINALRARTLARARGRVLEVGFGTGLNARHYGTNVSELVVVDSNAGMARLAHERLQKAHRHAEHHYVSGESLPLGDHSFDTVVITFTLCSIPNVMRAISELRRVLKPDGQLLFCEHNLSEDPKTAAWQRRITPLWRPFAGGCHLDRDTPALLASGGFVIQELEKTQLTTSSAMFGTIRRGIAQVAHGERAPHD
jgi:ubiquinone/menaquinone biosynthesis C-methylase UbiE